VETLAAKGILRSSLHHPKSVNVAGKKSQGKEGEGSTIKGKPSSLILLTKLGGSEDLSPGWGGERKRGAGSLLGLGKKSEKKKKKTSGNTSDRREKETDY